MKPGNFFAELKRRNVLRAAAFYAATVAEKIVPAREFAKAATTSE